MFSFIKRILFPKTEGEPINLNIDLPSSTFVTTTTEWQASIARGEWLNEFKAGQSYTPHVAYDFKDKTIEELNAMHKEEVIRNAQKLLPHNYKEVTTELRDKTTLNFIH